jgi:hypothetical protein
MKKLILITLVLAMLLSMTACGCKHQWEDATCQAPKTCTLCGKSEGETANHTPGNLQIASVDTENLTITHALPCSVCGEVMETKSSSTGIAPVNSVIHISPDEWYECLLTNIRSYGAGQSLYGYPVESADNALLHSVVSMSQMNVVFSFLDTEGNVITTDSRELRNQIHNIRMDAQFTNDNAKEFFMLLMLVLLNNNAALDPADANTLTGQIMGGQPVTDNGYVYAMEIISVENHTVCVSMTAE